MKTEQYKYNEITFQLIVESAPNAFIMVNKEGKIAYVNSHAEQLFKYIRSELIGQSVEILIPERLKAKHPEYVEQFFKSPNARSMGIGRELYARKKDGTEFPVEIGLSPLVTVEGTLVLAAIIDISERKKAEARFKLVVESAPNAMVLVNPQGTITLVNRQTEELFGYERSELIGKNQNLLIPERFRKKHPQYRKQFYEKPQARPMRAGRDLFALKKDGSEIPVEIALNPIDTSEGLFVLVSIIDITQRINQQYALKKQIELEAKNKELEEFVYIASHDLREPLRTISNYIQVIEEDYPELLNSDINQYLNSISKAIERMDSLIGGLLDYSLLGSKGMLEITDLNILLENVKADLNSMFKANKATLHINSLPTLSVYPTEMYQLFQNLITNAIKFKKPDTAPTIEINAAQKNNKWQFSIRDNGIGIEEKHFARIFHIFQKLNNDNHSDSKGIGLANCKKIVELHNGEIWIESVLGQGSTFHFTIEIN